jgi:hypothetical protein
VIRRSKFYSYNIIGVPNKGNTIIHDVPNGAHYKLGQFYDSLTRIIQNPRYRQIDKQTDR